jgi:hypothetical protein
MIDISLAMTGSRKSVCGEGGGRKGKEKRDGEIHTIQCMIHQEAFLGKR